MQPATLTRRSFDSNAVTSREIADIVVLGGGIIGLTIAYEASRRGMYPLVLDEGGAGSGAVRAATGLIAPAAEADHESPALLALALESHRLYPQFVAEIEACSGIDCGFRPEGSLLVALDRDHIDDLERRASLRKDLGLPAEWLRASDVTLLEPALSPRVLAGLSLPEERQVDPRRLVAALAVLARANGTVRERVDVRDLAYEPGGVCVIGYEEGGTRRTVEAPVVVATAGAWTHLLPFTALNNLALRAVKSQVLRLRGAPLLRHIVRSPDVYLVPRLNGELVIGATEEEQGFDLRPTAGAALHLLRQAWRMLPGIAELTYSEHAVGLRPAMHNNVPAIGCVAASGLYVATGHDRQGVLLAPATAHLLLDFIESGRIPPLLEALQPGR